MPVRDLLSAASGASSAGPSDPYFYDVTLLLNGDGTNGAQNNTFLDSSTNNFTITRNGNTTQGSFSPYGSNWSVYDSGGNYLSTTYSGSVATNGDFTVEGWFYLSAYPNNSNLAVQGATLSIIAVQASGNFSTYMSSSGWVSHGAFPLNQWNYCVVQRSSGTVSSYLNGTRLDTYSASDGWTYSDLEGLVGQSANRQVGYYSNIRISSVARYSGSTMTVPTAPISTDGSTTFLLCSSNNFIDASGNNRNVTVNNSPKIQRLSPFNPTAPYSTATIGGSGYFDGSGDYLTSPSNSAYTLGSSGDFTVDGWFYMTSDAGGIYPIATNYTDWNSGYLNCFYIGFSGNVFRWYGSGGSTAISTSSYKLNCWNYFNFTRSGSTITGYLNDILIGTQSSSQDYTATNPLLIGGGMGSGSYFKGYISNIRIIKGATVSGSTVPTLPATAVNGTTFLGNMTNAGIPDLAMQNDLETVGSAQVSTSVKKYGTGSLSFDGSSTLQIQAGQPWYATGTADFTVEGWFYRTTDSSTNSSFWSLRNDGGNNFEGIYYPGDGTYLRMDYDGMTICSTGSGTQLSANTWYHIAWVRYNGTIKIYLNGISVASTSTSYNANSISSTMQIGGPGPTGVYLTGYIDDFRFTKGYARYTANFTPPTEALPTY